MGSDYLWISMRSKLGILFLFLGPLQGRAEEWAVVSCERMFVGLFIWLVCFVVIVWLVAGVGNQG